MEKQEILEAIDQCISVCDAKGITKNVDLLIDNVKEEEASKLLSILIFNQYSRYKADALAKVMEIIIRHRPNLALLKHPENFFFRLVIITGSKDLYDCYIEESVEPYISKLDDDGKSEYVYDLYIIAQGLTDKFFENYKECVKGIDYNGAFGRYEMNDNLALINQEDYETLGIITENFNTIVGRRDILKMLISKSEIE